MNVCKLNIQREAWCQQRSREYKYINQIMHHLTEKRMRGRGLGQEFSSASKQVCSQVGILPNLPQQRWAIFLRLMRILQKRIFFPSGMHQIASSRMCSCTVRTQVFLSRAPPSPRTQEHLLQSHSYKSMQKRMSIILWMLPSTGTRLRLHMLLSSISSQLLYLSHHSQPQPPSPVKAESLQVSLLWSPANCKY